jgi:hypothetical protein
VGVKVGIDMGVTSQGDAATMDLEELLATRLLVQGNSGSGKSHLLRRMLEQSAPWVQQAVIDPEGDFVTLAEVFGHVVIDAADHREAALQQIGSRVRQHRVSVVLNLENHETEMQMRAAAAFLGGLFEAERDNWYPMLVVVDEAQLFAPAVAGEVTDEARKASLGAMTNLMCRGRKRGLAGVIATQRLAKLAKNVAAEASNFLMGRTFLDIDMARAADLLGMERKQAEAFRDLKRGQFMALGPAIARRPLTIRVGAVQTQPRATSPKLLPLPETPPEDARELLFKPTELEPLRPVVRRPSPAVAEADTLRRIAVVRPAPEPETPAAEREAIFAQVMRDLLDDPEAAYRSEAILYQDFLVRCRGCGVNGRELDLSGFRRKLATVRAGADAVADSADWEQALRLSAGLPEDMQGVFLLLARAALTGAPCPSDADIARVRGSRSLRRARGLLDHLESRGVIACAADVMTGQRVLTVPELGWRTAPGDPHAGSELLAG